MVEPPAAHISTTSAEEGLDFAASLLTVGIEAQLEATSESGAALAISLSRYVRLRYVGELALAWAELVGLSKELAASGYRHEQFLRQLRWVAQALDIPPAALSDG